MTPLFLFHNSCFLQNPIDAVLFRKQTRACNKRKQAKRKQSIYEEFSHRPKIYSILVSHDDSSYRRDRLQSVDSEVWNRRPV
jgi:hypothetical protein